MTFLLPDPRTPGAFQIIGDSRLPNGNWEVLGWIDAPAGAPTQGITSPQAISTSTGVNPIETSYSLYGHTVPLSVFGVGRIGGEIIAGPWVSGGLASFIISFGVPADPSGTRDLREIAFDSEVVWSTSGATGVTTTAGGTFTVEPFTCRFYQGTLSQAADTLESTHFGADAVAYRPQILLAFSDLPIANTKFGKIPYVSAVIGDGSGDDVNLGEAFERLAYSPWVGYTSAEFETTDITDGVVGGGLIIAQQAEFLSLIQQFGRFYPWWDILQTDKLRIVDRGAAVTADINLNRDRLMGKVVVNRRGADTVKKDLELSTIDPAADYTIVPSTAQRPRDPVAVTTSIGKDVAYLPIIMDSSTRLAIVTLAKYHEEQTRKTISGTAMAYGLEIEPGALVAVLDLNDGFHDEVFKVSETLHGVNNVVEFTAASILRCTTTTPIIYEAFNLDLLTDDFGWANTNIRQKISSAELLQSGTSTRLTLVAGSAGCAVDGIYIGNPAGSGDPYDLDGGQVQVTVGGSATFSIPPSTAIVTDAVPFALDATKDLLISYHITSGSLMERGGQSALLLTAYAKVGANESSVSNVSGYTTFGGYLILVSTVEVFV